MELYRFFGRVTKPQKFVRYVTPSGFGYKSGFFYNPFTPSGFVFVL